ncbi:hypothetical protein PoB_002180600 [Plakobranchus ocellatus]|uniref:Uncharacterized protein n=1 Tax=Plakobranchus ocellatus TaxID=259542 RepID=A0AAV3Z7K1_9GAST|nr:hypothetical protein PoB_002180600 [Plakobranchus ocellatus]
MVNGLCLCRGVSHGGSNAELKAPKKVNVMMRLEGLRTTGRQKRKIRRRGKRKRCSVEKVWCLFSPDNLRDKTLYNYIVMFKTHRSRIIILLLLLLLLGGEGRLVEREEYIILMVVQWMAIRLEIIREFFVSVSVEGEDA